METKIYVGNLPYDATEEEVRALFSQAGEVTTVTLINDRFSGQSKGFGFVEMADQASMQNAIQMFEGHAFKDRELKVNIARPKEDRRPPFRGQRGGGRDNRRGNPSGGARKPRY